MNCSKSACTKSHHKKCAHFIVRREAIQSTLLSELCICSTKLVYIYALFHIETVLMRLSR